MNSIQGTRRSGLLATAVVAIVLATVSLAACGGKSGSSSPPTTANPTAGAPAPTNPVAGRKPINQDAVAARVPQISVLHSKGVNATRFLKNGHFTFAKGSESPEIRGLQARAHKPLH